MFPYSKVESERFRRDWSGWEKTGCMLFLRPNYTLQARNFPVFYARTLGEDLKFALAHSMKGADFDSLTSQYSTQGPTLYMLAAVLKHPDASVDAVIDEFCAAFGPAAGPVKEYFGLWESVYPQYATAEHSKKLRAKSKYGATGDGPFYVVAAEFFTPEVMRKARSILEKAQSRAAGNELAAARVEWLEKGLKQADLLLAAEKAFEQGVDSGDETEFRKAQQALLDFRRDNVDYDKTHFAGLKGTEPTWSRTRR